MRVCRFAAAALSAVLFLGLPVASAAAERAVYAMTGRDTLRIGTLHRSIEFGGEERVRVVKSGSESTLVSNKALDDPDTVSVVSQPLPPSLRSDELRALESLQGRVSLDLPTRLSQTSLAGYLEPAATRTSSGLIGLHFAATARTTGSLPEYPDVAIEGVMTLRGTAYYSRSTGLLRSIVSRLTFEGRLRGKETTVPVNVSYERNIHVVSPVVAMRRGTR